MSFCNDDIEVCFNYIGGALKTGQVDILFKLPEEGWGLYVISEQSVPGQGIGSGKDLSQITLHLKEGRGVTYQKGWNHLRYQFEVRDDDDAVTVIVDLDGNGGPGSKGPTSTYPRA